MAGFLFFLDLCVNFNVAFIVTYNFKRKLINDPRAIAGYYIRRGTFRYDVVSTFAWLTQVSGYEIRVYA